MECIGTVQWDENNRQKLLKSLSWDEFKTSKILFQLVQLGLLEKAEDQKPVKKKPVSENFLSTVETELKKMIGPLAPLIITDKLSDLGETKESLGQDQACIFHRDARGRDFS